VSLFFKSDLISAEFDSHWVVPTLKSRKKHIPSFGWKFVLAWLEITAPYKLCMALWLQIGGSTIPKNAPKTGKMKLVK